MHRPSLCVANNPTGWTIADEEVDAVLAHCRRHGIWVLALPARIGRRWAVWIGGLLVFVDSMLAIWQSPVIGGLAIAAGTVIDIPLSLRKNP